jgi:hypothetical protein
MVRRERLRWVVRSVALCAMLSIMLVGCSWRLARNAAEVNLKAVKSIGADLVKYVERDPALDVDGKRIKKTKVDRAIKHAEKLLEVSQ